jgi:hypothetical protein
MQTQSRQKPQTKRQLVEDARQAAVEGRWEDAITINQGIIDRFPQDAEAFNRLGRAQLAFGNLTATHDAYVAALRIDPANLIARRNLQRLEIGKTLVEELVEPAEPTVLAEILPGEPLQLQAEGDGKRLLVIDKQGRQLGEIDPRFVERVIELQQDGNRYEIYSLGMTSQSLRIILREVYRDPDQANKVSFPGKIKATRAYLRERDLLRQRDEADFLLSEEDDEEEEAPPETSDDLDSGDTEPESLIEEALAEDEEDQQM